MTLLEAIKKAEEKQKYLGKNVKVYIRKSDWSNKFIDPTDFTWVNMLLKLEELRCTFNKTSTEFRPNKDDMTSNNWELFTHYLDLKEAKETKPESTSIPKETFINSIEQIAKAKSCLNSLNEHVKDIKTVFETTYGISFDCFKRNRNILIDKETSILYLFAIIASSYSKEINECLSKIEAEFDNLNVDKKTE